MPTTTSFVCGRCYVAVLSPYAAVVSATPAGCVAIVCHVCAEEYASARGITDAPEVGARRLARRTARDRARRLGDAVHRATHRS